METKKTNAGLMYGLVAGLVGVVFSLILYLGGVKWFISPIAYLGFVFPILFAFLACLNQKKANGGYMEFSEALKVAFTVFVLASVITTLFTYVLFNIIDVPFRQALTVETMEKMQGMMKKFGATQDQIDKATDEAVKGNSYSAGKMLLGTAFSLIFWFLISLIVAAIVKKKKPEFADFGNKTETN